ncbi:MAG TPA: adenylate/guanylate cyclase domain-containing protein [Bryobacteraceae bacterium]|nr:adenylate/guanylate cyclase domain-containing protein [Bryobacteraceae bacterium]HOL73169.1 adenylate/guanylate cyclase domain-containing protein [Bryobacteraceae bacterium]HOQ47802.1 adenylate/guanylate cyclase domain-containing protein [Bryobacteraceae bacterium]HPU73780.1 adenylate/guanylate cyclase domain-containing protein [Bryobacteraceae bacterium]
MGEGEPQSGVKGRILLVDDSLLGRTLISRELAAQGYGILEARDGREALELLAREAVDVVLLDMIMPEMDGAAVLRQMKSDPALASIPVIMVSAEDDMAGVAAAIEMGAEDYLAKPPNPVVLRARIGASIERKRLADAERRRAEEAEAERQAAEALLRNILPKSVAEELRTKGSVAPRYYEDATIAFTDFVGFTCATENLAAQELVEILNTYFTAFDRIVARYELEKLKTIGDSFMFAAGLPERTPSHPVDAVLAGLEMLDAVANMHQKDPRCTWRVRIGVHTGPVIAGVVGESKFAFDVWGDTVNLSARMEAGSQPGRLNISERTYVRVKDFFACEPRGRVRTKDGKETEMYFVNGIHPALTTPADAFRRRYEAYFGKPLPPG